ncbi:hypothetical protein FVEG_15290 [Fusarium verticillioides 7600]|uniref:Uncharacterized protein n=1 Tax=Gibberella moniliformis (strain M3125 / FGSC 7600) TaxID=334819 RepID=W7LSA1_GIBM7|nr:hypothetical protein FVEG_15290 [Fusarium verticillioides 7600]EWG41431.1 hypothetical protein FVEG_15290 [Fusarium verticillioides 7600]
MPGMSPHSSSFASGDHHIATAGSSLASIHRAEPAYPHNVDIYIWEISYQSAIAIQGDVSSPLVSSAPSPSTADPGTSSQSQQPHQSPIEDTDQYRSVSPTTPVTIDLRLGSSPPEEVLPAHNESTRPALCPKCRDYTSKRSFNLKRHLKSCEKKVASSRSKATENTRSRVSGTTAF